MSGRGVITSLTWVLANRTTAVISRSSSVSCTGAGGTSGTLSASRLARTSSAEYSIWSSWSMSRPGRTPSPLTANAA